MSVRLGMCVLLATGDALAGCATVASAPPALTVPFDSGANEVAVKATVNGRPLNFLLDTAVDPSALDRPVAEALGLRPLGAGGLIEGVGTEAATAFPAQLPDLTIGGRNFGRIDVLVNDMSKIRARFGAPLDGVLGYSLLKDHAVLIDYSLNQVKFFDGSSNYLPGRCRKSYRFPLRFRSEDDRLILVPGLRINGIEVPAMLDTGSSGGLRIEPDAPALGRVRSLLPQGEAGTSVGARGQASLRRGILTAPVTLGQFRVDQAEVALVALRNPDVPINIGNKFLRSIGAKLLVDIPGKKVALFGNCR